MKTVCNVCGGVWNDDDLQRCVWAGVPLRWSKESGQLICPECYDEMKAAFIASPEQFKKWKQENFARTVTKEGVFK